MTTVLVVDDEPQIIRALRINLAARGYDVKVAISGHEALGVVAEEKPDVVVLDLGLPDIDGVEVITRLRAWTVVPIVVLTVESDSSRKVQALDAGADDYVTKPFGTDELLARLRAAVRRASLPQIMTDPVVTTAAFSVDLSTKKAHRDGREVHLTATEWGLLEQLARNCGKVVPQKQLLREVWGPEYENEVHYLRVYIGHLRRKLEPDLQRPRHIITSTGMGYRLEP
jgi:two-component system KDP operon response regulator KdpE